jgi:inner membrane transporter RhtA
VSASLAATSRAPDRPPADGAFTRAAAAVPPPALLLVSIVSIQLGAAVAVNLFPVLGTVATTFLRLAFAAVLLVVAARHTIAWSAARLQAMPLLLYGTILGVMNLCFYAAISRIPLGIAVAIEFVGPLGLAVATSRRPRDFAWIGLAVLGVVLLTPEIGSTLDPVGVVLAGAAGSCWAGFIVLSRRLGRSLPGNSGLAIGMAVAVAILSTALPLSLEFEALKRLTARTYGILVTMEPAVAAVVGALLLGQAMGPQGVLAIACVTIAALGVTISDRLELGA